MFIVTLAEVLFCVSLSVLPWHASTLRLGVLSPISFLVLWLDYDPHIPPFSERTFLRFRCPPDLRRTRIPLITHLFSRCSLMSLFQVDGCPGAYALMILDRATSSVPPFFQL